MKIHLVKTLIISLDSNTPQDVLDVFGRWVVVATQNSQQVSGHVTHSRKSYKYYNRLMGFSIVIFYSYDLKKNFDHIILYIFDILLLTYILIFNIYQMQFQ